MNTPTDISLQLFLAKELEEEIEIHKDGGFAWSELRLETWPIPRVTPREWDYVVRKVEERLTTSMMRGAYMRHLWNPLREDSDFFSATASWQARAMALAKTLGAEIQ